MANYIRVDDGEHYRLESHVEPAELTVAVARALEGGDSVTVGVEPPLGRRSRSARDRPQRLLRSGHQRRRVATPSPSLRLLTRRRQRPDLLLDLALHLSAELLQLGGLHGGVREQQPQEGHLLERQLECVRLGHSWSLGRCVARRDEGPPGPVEADRRVEHPAVVVGLNHELAALDV